MTPKRVHGESYSRVWLTGLHAKSHFLRTTRTQQLLGVSVATSTSESSLRSSALITPTRVDRIASSTRPAMPSPSLVVALAASSAVAGYATAALARRGDDRRGARPSRAPSSSGLKPLRRRRHHHLARATTPELDALRAATPPAWHEDGSPEERVAQLGLELDGRVATNPAGVFYPVVLVGDLAYVRRVLASIPHWSPYDRVGVVNADP